MSANIASLYAEAWTAPRQSMRRILSLNLGERDRLIMVAITGVLFAIPVTLLIRSIDWPPMPDGTPMVMPSALMIAFFVMVAVAMNYLITAALMRWIGGLFGGKATYRECKTLSAWTLFVIGVANVALTLVSFALPQAIGSFLGFLFMGISLYVSSVYISEAHGFTSVGKVVLVYLAVFFVLMLLVASILPATGMQPQ